MEIDQNEFIIPRHGDILLNIIIQCSKPADISMFQYTEMGSSKIVYYDFKSVEGQIVIAPFTHGIPLLHIGKNIYLSVDSASSVCSIVATYAFLDSPSRRLIGEYCNDSGDGLRLRHIDGRIYKIYNIADFGYSPNVLAQYEQY